MLHENQPSPATLLRLHCKRCGHEWVPRVASPACCPSCKSRFWLLGRPPNTIPQKGVDGVVEVEQANESVEKE